MGLWGSFVVGMFVGFFITHVYYQKVLYDQVEQAKRDTRRWCELEKKGGENKQ